MFSVLSRRVKHLWFSKWRELRPDCRPGRVVREGRIWRFHLHMRWGSVSSVRGQALALLAQGGRMNGNLGVSRSDLVAHHRVPCGTAADKLRSWDSSQDPHHDGLPHRDLAVMSPKPFKSLILTGVKEPLVDLWAQRSSEYSLRA